MQFSARSITWPGLRVIPMTSPDWLVQWRRTAAIRRSCVCPFHLDLAAKWLLKLLQAALQTRMILSDFIELMRVFSSLFTRAWCDSSGFDEERSAAGTNRIRFAITGNWSWIESKFTTSQLSPVLLKLLWCVNDFRKIVVWCKWISYSQSFLLVVDLL